MLKNYTRRKDKMLLCIITVTITITIIIIIITVIINLIYIASISLTFKCIETTCISINIRYKCIYKSGILMCFEWAHNTARN